MKQALSPQTFPVLHSDQRVGWSLRSNSAGAVPCVPALLLGGCRKRRREEGTIGWWLHPGEWAHHGNWETYPEWAAPCFNAQVSLAAVGLGGTSHAVIHRICRFS